MGDNKGFVCQTGSRSDRSVFTPGAAFQAHDILAHDTIITRVDWGKGKLSPYHEYLVVYFKECKSDGANPRKSAVLIEREVRFLVVREEDPNAPPTKHPNLIFWKNGKQVAPPVTRLVRDPANLSMKP